MTISLLSKSGLLNVPPTALINDPTSRGNVNFMPGTDVASGALTADTYPGTAQISVSGAGVLNSVTVYTADTTSRILTCKILIDGTEIIEHASSAITTTATGSCLVGAFGWASPSGQDMMMGSIDQIPFSALLQIFLKSSVSETDKSYIKAMYRTI